MVEPVSILAGAVTTYILPKALEKIGEKVGEAALAKSGEAIIATREAVQNKLQSSGTVGLLKRAEDKPTEQNIQTLQAEIVNQMKEDQNFKAQLQDLIAQIQALSPSLQVVLDQVRIKGRLDMGDVKQTSAGSSVQQIVGRNLGVAGDVKIGNITQENQQ